MGNRDRSVKAWERRKSFMQEDNNHPHHPGLDWAAFCVSSFFVGLIPQAVPQVHTWLSLQQHHKLSHSSTLAALSPGTCWCWEDNTGRRAVLQLCHNLWSYWQSAVMAILGSIGSPLLTAFHLGSLPILPPHPFIFHYSQVPLATLWLMLSLGFVYTNFVGLWARQRTFFFPFFMALWWWAHKIVFALKHSPLVSLGGGRQHLHLPLNSEAMILHSERPATATNQTRFSTRLALKKKKSPD